VVWEGKKKNIAIDRLATGVPWCRMASGDPDIDMITYGYIGLLHVDAPEKALLGPGKFLLGTRFGPANPVAFPFICQVVERKGELWSAVQKKLTASVELLAWV
jgi:hypothetical protein